MTKLTDLEIIELMNDVDEKLAAQYNATLVLTGYGEYLETFNGYPENVQNLILNQDISGVFKNAETNEADYFDLIFG
ncbi:hypothetical protein [Candidatus Enterococcus ikei]|uniref:Uncharacterized protein n=1 Tax=Candidatus Enterococcus ikei TaxID=2815326 RepID=A0ABS3H1T7_9ENTE|nr:hypothetical protein [Enterococcus sp. DIV0869a]MBO0441499.1 hypothetical protein [Enterococcus sp. DIV0869a]